MGRKNILSQIQTNITWRFDNLVHLLHKNLKFPLHEIQGRRSKPQMGTESSKKQL